MTRKYAPSLTCKQTVRLRSVRSMHNRVLASYIVALNSTINATTQAYNANVTLCQYKMLDKHVVRAVMSNANVNTLAIISCD